MKGKKKELTEAEWKIIKVVWDAEPCTAPEIQEKLQGSKGWSYSTVKTLMDRMVEKGLLKTERIRNLMLYRSALSRKEAQKFEIMKAVRRALGSSLETISGLDMMLKASVKSASPARTAIASPKTTWFVGFPLRSSSSSIAGRSS